jgi:hypothetical protein
MATYTIQAAGLRWLPGTVVGAYPQWSQPQQPPLGAPSGTPTATGTVTSLGVLVFTGLADDESYYAATSTGAGGYIAFTTSSGVATSSAVTISAALPAGTNNIGDVDVLSVPALFTDGTQKSKLVDTAGTNVAAVSAAGRLSVDASGVTVPVSGSVSIGGGDPGGHEQHRRRRCAHPPGAPRGHQHDRVGEHPLGGRPDVEVRRHQHGHVRRHADRGGGRRRA